MKQFVTLLVIVFTGIALYTIYGLLTFQPDEQKPFVFNAPVLPADIQTEQKAAAPSLSVGEEQLKGLAMNEAQKAIDTYQIYRDSAPQQVKDTVTTVINMIEGWSLPSYFLSAPDASAGGMRVFQMLSLNVTDMATDKSPLDCKGKDAAAGVVVGSSGQDVLSCGLNRDITGKTFEKDVVFIGGPDNDKITDSVGNRIINGGTGDDSISVGAGRTLLVLDAAWGHDTVTMDCTGATVNEAEIQKGFPIPWVYKTTNFIVLGDGIDPKDVSWKDNVLTNTVTGDTLTVNQNCFTVVPSVQ